MSDENSKKRVLRKRSDGVVQSYWTGRKPRVPAGGASPSTGRENLRGGLLGVLSDGTSSQADEVAGVSGVRVRAERFGVNLSKLESTESDADDVVWSTNDWCFQRDGIIEAADIVVVRDGERGPEVLCIRRSHPPFASTWALPGGLRDDGETLQVAADRELEEETGIRAEMLGERRWLGELHATDWDPRSVGAHVGAAMYRTTHATEAVAGDDAVDAQWVAVEDIAGGEEVLAFGHAHWVAAAFASEDRFAERLDVVAEASRYRNRRIIEQVNEVRRVTPNVEEIPVSSATGSWSTR